MTYRRRIITAIAAFILISLGPVTSPAGAAPEMCRDFEVNVKGTSADESFHIYPDRVEITDESVANGKPTVIQRSGNSKYPFTISTGTGNDIITAHDNVDFVACFGGATETWPDRVIKEAGAADVFFAGRGLFHTRGGSNTVHIAGQGTFWDFGAVHDSLVQEVVHDNYVYLDGNGTVNTLGGNDYIYVGGSASVRSGEGDDYVHISGWGRVLSGPGDDYIDLDGLTTITMFSVVISGEGDDKVYVDGRVNVDGGPGDDFIVTGSFDDHIVSGPGADEVRAGGGKDECTVGREDTYTGCEVIHTR